MSNVSLVCVNHPPADWEGSFNPVLALEDDAMHQWSIVKLIYHTVFTLYDCTSLYVNSRSLEQEYAGAAEAPPITRRLGLVSVGRREEATSGTREFGDWAETKSEEK